jgi:hypothetical protein
MEIIYNWVISAMDEYPTTPDNLTDVVFNVHWRRNATTVVDEISATKIRGKMRNEGRFIKVIF